MLHPRDTAVRTDAGPCNQARERERERAFDQVRSAQRLADMVLAVDQHTPADALLAQALQELARAVLALHGG